MDLQKTVAVNRKLIALIESKYQEPVYAWPNTIERRYFEKLQLDTYQAEKALKAGGLALPTTEP